MFYRNNLMVPTPSSLNVVCIFFLLVSQGKPRSVCGGDDGVLDRFGRALGERGGLSKHQLKKRKKLAKQKARGGKGKSVDREAELQSRLSEKRRPGDEQLLAAERARAEQQAADCRVPLNGVPGIIPSIIVVGGDKKEESLAYKALMQARTARRRQEQTAAEGSSEEEEDDDEDLEYDHDDDLDENGKIIKRKFGSTRSLNTLLCIAPCKSDNEDLSVMEKALNNKNILLSRLSALTSPSKTSPVKINGVKDSDDTADDVESEEESEDSDEEEEEDDEDDDSDEDEDSSSEDREVGGETDLSRSQKKGSSPGNPQQQCV